MILGVDHIALSCASTDSAVTLLEAAGYHLRFRERGLMNHPAKRPFLARYQPRHDIAYMSVGRGIAIELTAHGGAPGSGASFFQVALDGRPKMAAPFSGDPACGELVRVALDPTTVLTPCSLPGLEAPLWVPEGDHTTARIRTVLVPATDVQAAISFWTDWLGFVLLTGGAGRVARLRFASRVPSWALDLALVPCELQPAHLDDTGFTCLALLTTDVARDSARIADGGAHVGEIFELVVNGRSLRVVIARAPQGGLIELIQVLP